MLKTASVSLMTPCDPIPFLRVPGLGGGGINPAAYNSRIITDVEVKFGGVVENPKRNSFV